MVARGAVSVVFVATDVSADEAIDARVVDDAGSGTTGDVVAADEATEAFVDAATEDTEVDGVTGEDSEMAGVEIAG